MSSLSKDEHEAIKFIAFKKGDEKAFEYFFHKYYSQITGFCISFIYDKSEAQGIAQEAFLNLWKHKNTIQKATGVSSFLYTFSKSKCLNVLRHNKVKDKYKNKKLNQQEQNLNISVLESMAFDSLTFTQLEDLILESLSELPTKAKEVFLKKRFEKKKNKEIAEEMGVSVKTVEAHFSKAIRFLKIKLSDYLPSLLLFFIFK